MDAFFGKQGKSIRRSALALAIKGRIPSGRSGARELRQEAMEDGVGEDRDGLGAPGGCLTRGAAGSVLLVMLVRIASTLVSSGL